MAAVSPTNENFFAAFWRKFKPQLLEATTNPYLFALLIGSLMLSAASFYTTFHGMLDFMPVYPVTFCIVFAIQALLFVTSWRIGFALSNREGFPLFTFFVFLVCLATSVFFSWVALFGSINDEATQERTRTTRIHRAVEDATSSLATRLVEARRTQAEAMLASPDYAAWSAALEAVGDEAVRARSAIQAALDVQAEETAARIRRLEEERARILRGEATEAERVASAERELARLEETRPPLFQRVGELQSQFDEAAAAVVIKEGEMLAEETGGAGGNGVGRGPIWRGLRDERNVLAARRDAIDQLLRTAQADLSRADARIEELRATIAAAGATAGAAELAVIDRRMASLEAQIDGEDRGGLNLEAEVEAMRADLALFRSRLQVEPFDRAAGRCEGLLEAMRTRPELASRVGGLSCDVSALTPYLSAIRVAQDGEARLAAACIAGGPGTPVVSDLDFQSALAFGRGCVDVSGLPSSAVSDLRDRFGRLVLEEDPDGSQMVKTVNAFNDGDRLSYIALAIALFIDLLVLFSGLIGALTSREKITEHLGGRKLTARRADAFVKAMSVSVEQIDAEGGSPQTVIARAILRSARPRLGDRSTPAQGADKREKQRIAAHLFIADIRVDRERWLVRQFMTKLVAEREAFVDEELFDAMMNAEHRTATDDASYDAAPPRTSEAFYLTAEALDALREQLFAAEADNPEGQTQSAEQLPPPAPSEALPPTGDAPRLEYAADQAAPDERTGIDDPRKLLQRMVGFERDDKSVVPLERNRQDIA